MKQLGFQLGACDQDLFFQSFEPLHQIIHNFLIGNDPCCMDSVMMGIEAHQGEQMIFPVICPKCCTHGNHSIVTKCKHGFTLCRFLDA